jgi:phenylpyruvate tautomerase
MPYLKLKTNVAIGDKQAAPLLSGLSRLLAQETGKPERYVMTELVGGLAMTFAGTGDPLAFVECKSIGLSRDQAKSLSASICRYLTSELKLPAERVYIEFGNAPAEFWGWNSATFG